MASPQALDTRSGHPTINADLQDAGHQLRQEFANRLETGEVDECLNRIAARFEVVNVSSFVPLLVRRYARDELQARLANAQLTRWPTQDRRQAGTLSGEID